MPKISVIVPVYNVKQYLQRCIDSIEAQTYEDFEIYLIDDGSPDDCAKICDEYIKLDPRIHIIHQRNGGLSAARNSGIDCAIQTSNSEWITFIDSDDWIYPEYLEFLYRAAIEENVLISVCGTAYEKSDSHHMREQRYQTTKMSSEDYWVCNNGEVSVAWEKLYKKELFNYIRFPVGKIYEDEFTTYKILFSSEVISVLDNRLYIYYYSDNSIMRSNWSENKFANIDATLEQLDFFLTHGYKKAEVLARERLAQVIRHDINIIRNNPNRYRLFIKIIDDKIEEYYLKRKPYLSCLPFINGKVLRKTIVITHMAKSYYNAVMFKLNNSTQR